MSLGFSGAVKVIRSQLSRRRQSMLGVTGVGVTHHGIEDGNQGNDPTLN
jgi:hypothetical protein